MNRGQVRRATPADAEEIADVHRVSRAAYYGSVLDENDDRVALRRDLLGSADRLTYVVEDGGRLVAFMSARRSVHSSVLELTAIYVRPEAFGTGVGSRLHTLFEAERKSSEGAILEVWAGNDRAIDFYVRRGWAPTSAQRPGPQDRPFVTYRLEPRGGVSS